jgi:hypothetical protein
MKKSALIRDDSKRIKVLKSEEFREKQRKNKIGKKWSDETREKMKKVMDDDYKKKMSDSCKKVKKTEDWIDKIALGKGGSVYTIISPENVEYSFVNVRRFCRDHNLHRFKITDVLKGKRLEWQGWRIPT